MGAARLERTRAPRRRYRKARDTIRKTVTALAMVFDHAGITPNPARDKIRVKLPREETVEPAPPSADHVEAACRHLTQKVYRLAALCSTRPAAGSAS
jgi:hypothetical protein